MSNLTVYQHLEDFDNSELSPSERISQLEDAVRTFNEENNTGFDPARTVRIYLGRQKAKNEEPRD